MINRNNGKLHVTEIVAIETDPLMEEGAKLLFRRVIGFVVFSDVVATSLSVAAPLPPPCTSGIAASTTMAV